MTTRGGVVHMARFQDPASDRIGALKHIICADGRLAEPAAKLTFRKD
jgi:hypothetical protein